MTLYYNIIPCRIGGHGCHRKLDERYTRQYEYNALDDGTILCYIVLDRGKKKKKKHTFSRRIFQNVVRQLRKPSTHSDRNAPRIGDRPITRKPTRRTWAYDVIRGTDEVSSLRERCLLRSGHEMNVFSSSWRFDVFDENARASKRRDVGSGRIYV